MNTPLNLDNAVKQAAQEIIEKAIHAYADEVAKNMIADFTITVKQKAYDVALHAMPEVLRRINWGSMSITFECKYT